MSKGRILIVDDEPAVRDSMFEYLSRMDFDVVTTDNVEEALSLFKKQPFDLLITDLVMPGASGMELIEKTNQIDAEVPKIIVTGLGTINDAIEAIRKGAYDYLEKPLPSYSQLLIIIRRAIEKRRLLSEHKRMEGDLAIKNEELSAHVKELEATRGQLAEQAGSLKSANELINRQYQILQEDLLNARRIQQDLLPSSFPKEPGLSFAAFNFPSNKIGGDFYDAHRIDNDHISFYIADVAGHGVGSAMMTVFVKQTIAERLLLTDQAIPISPADVIKELNYRLVRCDFPKSMFLTAWCGLYRISDRMLFFSSAGHHPGLLFRKDGSTVDLSTGGIAIGWTDEVSYRNDSIQQEPGDRLLLYTDGLTDSINKDGEPFSISRVIKYIKKSQDQSVQNMAHALLEALNTFMDGRPAQDDISLLLFSLEEQDHV